MFEQYELYFYYKIQMSEEMEEKLIWDNIEWFTPTDYLETPSWGTVSEEYPDERGEVMKKSNVFHNNTPILNQWNVWACSVFWITKAENEADFYDEGKVLDAMKIWDEAVKDGIIPNQWKNWWSMSWALNLMKNKWYISWFYFIKTIEDIRSALEKKHLCYTGTRNCNWTQTKKTWVFTYKEMPSTGHLFAVIGIDFDENCLWAANSWGEDWGKHEWLFKIPFTEMEHLYSIVAVIDRPKDIIDEGIAKDLEDSKLMKEMWVWNGENPDSELIKLHSVYMVMRAFVQADIPNDEAVELAKSAWIVGNISMQLTRRHFLLMVFRAWYAKTYYEDNIPEIMKLLGIVKTLDHLDEPITRYHASLIIARTLRSLWKIK